VFQNGTDHRRDAAARRTERRGAVRHSHAERVALATQWGALAGNLLDLSTSGAQVRLANGLVPFEGEDVTLRLVDGRHISGSVAWADRDALGITFENALPCIEDLLWLEQRGPDWFYANVRAQQL
jgi:hypothetical protein